MFWFRGSASISELSDGTSNTVAVFENHHWAQSREFPGETNKTALWFSPIGAIDNLQTDGRVRFVSENIDHGVQRTIATRGGSETVSEF